MNVFLLLKIISQKQFILSCFLLFGLFSSSNICSQSIQNFGTSTGTFNTSNANSTSVLDNPTSSGTTYARISNGSGGSINEVISGNPLGTTATYVRAAASSSSSVVKVSPIVNATGSTAFYARFKVLFGDASGTATATSGIWQVFFGNGAMYNDNSGFTGTQCFAGFQFAFGASGNVVFQNRNGGSWNNTGINSTYQTLNSSIFYDFEIVGNNKDIGAENYNYNGFAQTVAINCFDLYVNGFLVGNDLPKAQLANNTMIRSTTFNGISSSGNVANIFLDDVSFQNSIPSSIQRLTNPSIFDLAASNYSFTNWPSTSAIGTYPANMVFHWGTVNTVDPTLTNTATQDYVWGYNYTSQSRINGQNANGFSFLNTSPGHVSATSGNCGEAVVSIKTSCRNNIQVSWTAARQTDNGNRYLLRAQYRVGNSGAYTDLPGATSAIEFSSASAGPTNFGPITLPSACDNQSEVQIRWVYYWSGSGSGSRDEIRLDEIAISSSASNPSAPAAMAQYFCATNNPTVSNLEATGSNIQWYSASSGGTALASSASLSNGNYFATQTINGCESVSRTSTAVALTTTAFPTIVASEIGSSLQSGDLLWNGNSSNSWSSASNWFAFDGVDFATAPQLPAASNRVFVLRSNINGICSSNGNSVISIVGEASDVFIGASATLTINAGRTLSVDGNWTNNGTFTPDPTAIVAFVGANTQTINGASIFTNLTVNKSATLTLNASVTVSGNLTMTNGNIATSAGNLLTVGTSVANPGSLTWTAGNIVGPVRRYFANSTNASQASGIFPVGLGSTNRNAQVNFTSGLTTGGTITAEYKVGVCPVGYAGLPVVVNGQVIQNYENEGYWEITPNGGNLNAATYSLSLRGNNLSTVNNLSLLRIIKSISHTTWDMTEVGTQSSITGSAADLSIVNAGLTGFSFFNIGSGNANPLPVQLLSFTADCQNSGFVSLNWTTASEQNSMKFIVEKSRDLASWVGVGENSAAGNSNYLVNYFRKDEAPFSGVSYYRLKQFDLDGKEETFDPISSNCTTLQNSFSVFPNPSNGIFSIEIAAQEEDKMTELLIKDLLGKIIYTQKVNLGVGTTAIFLNDVQLQSGAYMISLKDLESTFQPVKIVVKN